MLDFYVVSTSNEQGVLESFGLCPIRHSAIEDGAWSGMNRGIPGTNTDKLVCNTAIAAVDYDSISVCHCLLHNLC